MSLNINANIGSCERNPQVEVQQPENRPPIYHLPKDIFIMILEKLDPTTEDKNMLLVDKTWCRIVRDELRDPNLTVFGKEAWENLNFKIEGEIPPIPKGIEKDIRDLRRRFGLPQCSLILMPKGLSFSHFLEIVDKKGIIAPKELLNFIPFDQRDKTIESSYWFLHTEKIIPYSTNHYVIEGDNNYVLNQTKGTFDFPTMMEGSVCGAINFINKGKIVLNGRYFFCRETDNNGFRQAIKLRGLCEFLGGPELVVFNHDWAVDPALWGTAACRRIIDKKPVSTEVEPASTEVERACTVA